MKRKKEIIGKTTIKRKSKFIARLIIAGCCAVFTAAVTFLTFFFLRPRVKNVSSVKTLYEQWSAYNYKNVYDTATQILDSQPFNNAALTLKGYAGFYIAVGELDTTLSREYLDGAIVNMRVAMRNAQRRLLPQLYYMLGKAYFYKNTLSSYHYYADLVVKYLLEALKLGYRADDISEYLGLSYAALNMNMESISAFTEALLVRESDTLLMAIAEQYYKTGQDASAKQYLHRVITKSNDETLVNRGHMLLGQIYIDKEMYSDALAEFETILKNDANFADAHYWLGVIYEKQSDMVKARAEWRATLRIQAGHVGALKKMTDYK